jgi:hydroxymethylpyrimidine pyrophosphatase-like HAD family hydrolase
MDQLVPFPMVLLNGALALRPQEVVSSYRPFDQSVLKQLLDLTRSFRDVTFWFLSAEHTDIQWPSEYASQEARKFDLVTRPLLPDGDRILYGKVMCVSESHGRLMKIKDTLQQWPVEAAFSMEGLFEITPAGVDKCSGLQGLIHDLEMEGAPTYAAGNGDNDLEMFRLAELSFAPLSSPEHVREAASRLIDVRSDGLLMPMLQQIGITPKGCTAA